MMNYPKVQIIRAQKREGLIRARLLGAAAAKAPVLTYLDSHCECTEGWLEPLLDRIARDPTTVVCPVIDVIDDTTLEYHWKDSGGVNVGGFDWNLQVSRNSFLAVISRKLYAMPSGDRLGLGNRLIASKIYKIISLAFRRLRFRYSIDVDSALGILRFRNSRCDRHWNLKRGCKND